MNWREKRINAELKKHDPKLFLNKNGFGVYQVMREHYSFTKYDVDGSTLLALTPAHHYIMSLTEDWSARTKAVEWGLEPISRRLQMIDAWNPESLINKMEKHNQKVDERNQKHMANETEAFVKDWRSQFKEATKDVLTQSLSAKDRRRTGEKNGNC